MLQESYDTNGRSRYRNLLRNRRWHEADALSPCRINSRNRHQQTHLQQAPNSPHPTWVGREWHVDNREIDRASTIFAQAGIRLNVHMHSEPIEFRGADSIVAEEENSWSGLRMLVPETDGLVVMVVPVINGTSSGFSFGTGHREIVIDPNCVGDLLAHEIGHALGLEDIYGDSWDNPFGRKSLQRVVAHGCVSSEQFKKAQDWNGGSGARYYAYSFPRAYLIPRLLMCGSSLLAGSVDLPLSSVKGVGAVTENASFFQDVMCPVGCEDIFESQYAKEDEDE